MSSGHLTQKEVDALKTGTKVLIVWADSSEDPPKEYMIHSWCGKAYAMLNLPGDKWFDGGPIDCVKQGTQVRLKEPQTAMLKGMKMGENP